MIHLNFAGNDSRYTTITYSEKVRYLSSIMLLIPKRTFPRQTVHRMTFPRTIQKYYFIINLFNVNEM